MKKKTVVTVILIAAAAAVAVLSWFLLPDEVVVQIGLKGQATRTMPKLLALALPLGIAVFGAVLNAAGRRAGKTSGILVSVIGIAAMLATLLFNR